MSRKQPLWLDELLKHVYHMADKEGQLELSRCCKLWRGLWKQDLNQNVSELLFDPAHPHGYTECTRELKAPAPGTSKTQLHCVTYHIHLPVYVLTQFMALSPRERFFMGHHFANRMSINTIQYEVDMDYLMVNVRHDGQLKPWHYDALRDLLWGLPRIHAQCSLECIFDTQWWISSYAHGSQAQHAIPWDCMRRFTHDEKEFWEPVDSQILSLDSTSAFK